MEMILLIPQNEGNVKSWSTISFSRIPFSAVSDMVHG